MRDPEILHEEITRRLDVIIKNTNKPTTTYSGLSKIEPILNTPGRLPLAHELTRMSSFTKADMNIALKLSEVIEAVNRIIDYLNEMVKE